MASQLMSSKNDLLTKLFGIFLLALVLFNFPLLGLVKTEAFSGALPRVILYIFLAWGLIILLIYLVVRKMNNKD